MEDIRKLIVFLIINISAFLCYLLGKETDCRYGRGLSVQHFLDLCCRYIGAVTIVMLQGELNYISIPCLIAAGIILGFCIYRVGQNSKEKDK